MINVSKILDVFLGRELIRERIAEPGFHYYSRRLIERYYPEYS